MSTVSTTGQAEATATARSAPPGRISLAEYEGWIDSGAIEEGAPIELFEGRLVRKMTKGRRHCASSVKGLQAIERMLPPGWFVGTELPIRMPSSAGMPEPDLSVTRGEADDYLERAPGPADVALVVEIGDSSLFEDRRRAAVFLAEGYPAYWVVNIPDRRLEVYTPAGVEILPEGASVELILDGAAIARIAVADLLPRRTAD
ncbi:Uma2 family endonuclease [Aquisphaera insulae]|uniref:Uma2 family endonuclease n=1 Tax=Aquisphaera insulae TaxID=2712864 RepID=UPI0013ED0A9C|nr:Uma2 family endonuclease [Aquisphaera insulae]